MEIKSSLALVLLLLAEKTSSSLLDDMSPFRIVALIGSRVVLSIARLALVLLKRIFC